MNLTVKLTQKEVEDIAAWVGLYRAHPELIGVKNTGWPPNGQTRIVLDSCTKERFDEVAAQFPVTGPGPDPAAGPLARIDATTSQWAKYAAAFLLNDEIEALIARTGNPAKVHEVSAFYDVGGIGNVHGVRSGNAYQFVKNEVLTPDVDGAADKYVAAIADAQGKPVPRL